MAKYIYAQQADEASRLHRLSALLDGETKALLSELPVEPSADVWEVGGGTGSIAQWLAQRSETVRSVLMTDIDTTLAENLGSRQDRIQLRQHDILLDELPAGDYDLIHARYLLEHLPDWTSVLKRLASKLKPGGWLVIETSDPITAWLGLPRSPTVDRVLRAYDQIFDDRGGDSYIGRRLAGEMGNLGLEDLRGKAHATLLSAFGGPEAEVYVMSLRGAADRLVSDGLVTRADFNTALQELFSQPAPFFNHMTIQCAGKRPS